MFKGNGNANFTWVPYDELADDQKEALNIIGATVEDWNANDPSLQESDSMQEAAKLSDEQTQEKWWDGWCQHVAGNRHNRNLPTADAVSRFHVDAVKMETNK